ncbi:hypothetical protein Poly30_08390 [Planctomycetes bacterium Poly30]|uniref:Uncharacterized protein n=1 Tax=Saltatorellus ferox TaxID=2528018 RepID=A0A518EML9_9BACT|nr:hypothetical protein Poly30_08390 [Planctomycetes bacterium Poly30]
MRSSTIRNILNDPVVLQRGLGVVLWAALILVLLTNAGA